MAEEGMRGDSVWSPEKSPDAPSRSDASTAGTRPSARSAAPRPQHRLAQTVASCSAASCKSPPPPAPAPAGSLTSTSGSASPWPSRREPALGPGARIPRATMPSPDASDSRSPTSCRSIRYNRRAEHDRRLALRHPNPPLHHPRRDQLQILSIIDIRSAIFASLTTGTMVEVRRHVYGSRCHVVDRGRPPQAVSQCTHRRSQQPRPSLRSVRGHDVQSLAY